MSAELRRRLELGWWLLERGLGVSAKQAVRGVQDLEASRLRHAAAREAPVAGVYAMLASSPAEGICFPITVAPGVRRGAIPAATAQALTRAAALAARVLGLGSLPPCHVHWPDALVVDGASIGLPAALGLMAHFGDVEAPSPVFATGALDDVGGVHPVAHTAVKVPAAFADAPQATVLVPNGYEPVQPGVRSVATLDSAVQLVFGGGRMRPGLVASDVVRYLEALGAEADPAERIRALRRASEDARMPGDAAALTARLAAELRHVGRASEALELLTPRPGERGREVDERVLQQALSECDHFRFGAATLALEQRMRDPFGEARDELRFRGALAQAYSMSGDPLRAYRLRSANLDLHQYSAELARGEAGTRCALARDAAAAGDFASFARHVEALCEGVGRGQPDQDLYNAHAVVWGLDRLDRPAALLEWMHGTRWTDVPRPRVLTSTDPIVGYPAIGTARACAQVLERAGEAQLARAIRTRVPVQGAGLVRWLSLLVQLDACDGEAGRVAWMAQLQEAHADATRFYLSGEGAPGSRPVWY